MGSDLEFAARSSLALAVEPAVEVALEVALDLAVGFAGEAAVVPAVASGEASAGQLIDHLLTCVPQLQHSAGAQCIQNLYPLKDNKISSGLLL